MGRQWLHAKREVANLKKGQAVGKLVREIMIAAKSGGPDPSANARLATAIEKARKASVTRDAIERAVSKGGGTGSDKLALEPMVFEGYTPHKVPVIVEALTDNPNRTGPEIRTLFKKGQLGTAGSNKFLFDHVGIVEAHHPDTSIDAEAAAIEAGANEVEPIPAGSNNDIPENTAPFRFLTDRAETANATRWLAANGWTIVTSELGHVARQFPDLDDAARTEVGEFLQALDDHDDVHRVWAAVR
jgi:YebC/PmpR family DNA-binding regulatory protein